jgi:hypothetical protein
MSHEELPQALKDQLIERMKNESLTDELVDSYLEIPVELDEESMERITKRFKEKLRDERKTILDEELNDILLDLYPMTIANASLSAQEQRLFADDVANHIGQAKQRILDRL